MQFTAVVIDATRVSRRIASTSGSRTIVTAISRGCTSAMLAGNWLAMNAGTGYGLGFNTTPSRASWAGLTAFHGLEDCVAAIHNDFVAGVEGQFRISQKCRYIVELVGVGPSAGRRTSDRGRHELGIRL